MSAALAAQEFDHDSAPAPISEPLFYVTDPEAEIIVSEDKSVTDGLVIPRKTTYRRFFDQLSAPSDWVFTKDGPGYIGGFCENRRRRAADIKHLYFGVLDGDSSLSETGETLAGAPDPYLVHGVLKQWNISHHIYTTFSNGTKGYRYRILFPSLIENTSELRALMNYVVGALQLEANIPIKLTPESIRWNSRWHYPRIPSINTSFFSASHFGLSIRADVLAKQMHLEEEFQKSIGQRYPQIWEKQAEDGSLIDQFCRKLDIPSFLSNNGYVFKCQGTLRTPDGEEVPTFRFCPESSDSSPGVVAFILGGKWRVYSHHANDPLSNGYLNDALDVYRSLNSMGMTEETPYKEMADILQDIYCAEMASEFPVVMEGGKVFRIAKLVPTDSATDASGYRYLKFDDFKLSLHARDLVYVIRSGEDEKAVEAKNICDWWKTYRGRYLHDDAWFIPTRFGVPVQRTVTVADQYKIFNCFPGWGLKPNNYSDTSLLHWHLREVICSGNEEHYNYVLDWLAHLVQFPEEKPNVALVMRSGKGTGKSIFWSAIAKRIGPIGAVIAHSSQLTGKFNGHLQQRLLAVVEESFWAGSPNEEGMLKHLISDTETMTERKGVDATDSRSFIRVVLITNNQWAAPASDDERRYFIPTISDAGIERNKTEDYFLRLHAELNSGPLEALFTELVNRKINRLKVRKPPATEELHKQKLLSLTGFKAWAYDSLVRGEVVTNETKYKLATHPQSTAIPLDVIEASCAKYFSKYENGRSFTIRMRDGLTELFGPLKIADIGTSRCVVFPSIEQMRASFVKSMRIEDIDWTTL